MADDSTITLGPGMSYTCEAGEKLIIKALDGGELEIEGRDDPVVLAFLEAFDVWLTTSNGNIKGAVLDAAQDDMIRKFNALPARIQNILPSVKNLGIIVPGGHVHAKVEE